MATINNKRIVNDIIKNEGYYFDDPRVVKIVKYTNRWGGISYGLTYKNELNQYSYDEETEFIRNPIIIWQAD